MESGNGIQSTKAQEAKEDPRLSWRVLVKGRKNRYVIRWDCLGEAMARTTIGV
jgi:hypothetical protein